MRVSGLRVVPFRILLAAAFGACNRQRPGPVVAMEPRPNPPVGAAAKPADNPRDRLRQNRWLAQFWEELTPAQRRGVEARMRRAQPPLASDQDGARLAWDALGLAERDRLVFGAPARPAAGAASAAAVGAGGAEGDKPTPLP